MTKQEFTDLLEHANKLFEELKTGPSQPIAREWLQKFDELSCALEAISHPAALQSHVHPDAAAREAAEWAEQQETELATNISLSRELYNACAAATGDLSAEEFRLLTKIKADFLRSGVDKDEPTRARIREIEEILVPLDQEYSKNVREDVRTIFVAPAALQGLPEDYIAAHAPNADGLIAISTDYPDFFPFMNYSEDGAARKELFIAFNCRAYPINVPILEKVLALRHELAGLLGFPNWAAYITSDKMIKTPEAAREFINKIAGAAAPRCTDEYEILLKEKQLQEPTATALYQWDRAFYENKFKKRTINFDSKEVRAYFSYEAVEAGLLNLVSELYQIEFKAELKIQTWDAHVKSFSVWRGAEKIGLIHLDMHPREAKYKHAAQFPIKSGIRGKQLPEGALVCNMSTELLDHDQVVTMFHEFGHLMHHILGGQVNWQYYSGVATEWDFVEAPSQLFEEWAWDAHVLSQFARHHKTGEVIAPVMIQKMRSADDWGNGLSTRRQMAFAAISLELHCTTPESAEALEEKIAALTNVYGAFPHVVELHSAANFEHLIGYSAMYYTYMWSLVIAMDLRTGFGENLLDSVAAQKYAQTILAPGGSKDAADLIKDFLGRPYSFDAFEKWLNKKAA